MSCQGCIFQKLDKDGNQEACYMHDMNKLRYFTAYDNEKSYFVIKGLCQYKRDDKWQENRAFTDAMIDVRNEAAINYIAVIRPTKDIEAIKKTALSLSGQLHKPQLIVLVCEPDILKSSNKIVEWCKLNLKTKWSVLEPTNNSATEDVVMTRFRNYHFYAFFNAGYEVDRYKFYSLDCKINDEYLRFSLIEGDEQGNGIVVSRVMYNLYDCLLFKDLVEYIKEKHNSIKFNDL